MMGCLDGVRIIDFTRYAAGPQITLLLSFMGAEVIKVESMVDVDHFRRQESAVVWGSQRASVDCFNSLNTNKMSVTINLKTPKGVELAKRLVAIGDVVVDNFRAGIMDKLGLGYSVLKEIKPDIIMLSASSHGATGPESTYIAYAVTMGALSGLSQVTGYEGGPPTIMRSSADLRPGTAAAFAILAALNYREETGEGQFIDFSAREALSCGIGELIMDYTMNGRVRTRSGNRDDIMAPHNCYRCKGENKWVSIAVSNDEEWQALCLAIGKPELITDERFGDQFNRWKNQEELDKLIEEWTVDRTHYEVMEILQKEGVAAMPSFNNEEMFNNPHCKERGCFTPVDHPEEGKLYVVSPPWKLSDTPAEVTTAAPLLGEHNGYVFGELLGISRGEIRQMSNDKVLY
jgi:benzylsuccinate CoA-transferase BbsF subunit